MISWKSTHDHKQRLLNTSLRNIWIDDSFISSFTLKNHWYSQKYYKKCLSAVQKETGNKHVSKHITLKDGDLRLERQSPTPSTHHHNRFVYKDKLCTHQSAVFTCILQVLKSIPNTMLSKTEVCFSNKALCLYRFQSIK